MRHGQREIQRLYFHSKGAFQINASLIFDSQAASRVDAALRKSVPHNGWGFPVFLLMYEIQLSRARVFLISLKLVSMPFDETKSDLKEYLTTTRITSGVRVRYIQRFLMGKIE